MRTLIVGGGRGCRAVLDLFIQRRLSSLSPVILGVVDPNPEAPGMLFARQLGWPTFSRLEDALKLQGLELVVEVTGLE